MKNTILAASAAACLVLCNFVFAESGISTDEEHVLRGFFDRQSSVVTANKLALEKGSSEDVREYARAELDMLRTLGNDMAGLYQRFKLTSRPNPTGEYRPLEEGKSRGVDVLSDGATYSTVGILGQLDRKATTPAQTVRRDPATCQSTTVPGCGPTIAAGIDLESLSGKAFDNAYLLLTVYGHDAMMRHVTDQLLFEDKNPQMEAFAVKAIKLISAQSRWADSLYRGTTPRKPKN